MKLFIGLILAGIVGGVLQAQDLPPAPEWRATVKVIDELAEPIQSANVVIGHYVPSLDGQSSQTAKVTGLTDVRGTFTGSARSRSVDLEISVHKSGYYETFHNYELGLPYQYDPVKWSPTVTVVLKKIQQPIAMYAKFVRHGPPVFNQPVGFDLTAGDWVVPHGKGKYSDLIFWGKLNKESDQDFTYELAISFSNPGDGVQEFRVPHRLTEGSKLRSRHEAPADGYQSQVVRRMNQRPGRPRQDDSDKERNYFFRVRTVLDEKGKIKTTHYGKIYGDFMTFKYYLNPTPNSRNIEFDPKQNLFKGLKSLETVTQP